MPLRRMGGACIGHDGYKISEITGVANRGVNTLIGQHSDHDEKTDSEIP